MFYPDTTHRLENAFKHGRLPTMVYINKQNNDRKAIHRPLHKHDSISVDDVKNPNLPPWRKVLKEAGEAGYRAIELGPYGYLPIHVEEVSAELEKNGLSIVAGTIFDDLVDEKNYENLLKQTDDICSLITKLPPLPVHEGQHYPAPYLTVMDWGHEERDYAAGHSEKARDAGKGQCARSERASWIIRELKKHCRKSDIVAT